MSEGINTGMLESVRQANSSNTGSGASVGHGGGGIQTIMKKGIGQSLSEISMDNIFPVSGGLQIPFNPGDLLTTDMACIDAYVAPSGQGMTEADLAGAKPGLDNLIKGNFNANGELSFASRGGH